MIAHDFAGHNSERVTVEAVVRRRRIYRYLRLRHRKLGNAAHPLTRIRMVKPVKLERH